MPKETTGNNIGTSMETLKFLVYIVVLLLGIAGSYFTINARMNERISRVEAKVEKMEKELEKANVLVLATKIENIEAGMGRLEISLNRLLDHFLNQATDNPD